MYKNIDSQKVAVYAWDGAAGVAKTGDAANITAEISKDGAASAATNDVNPTELDATDHPGIYIFDLTQAETNADLVVITPVSATADIVIRPIIATPTLLTVAPPTVADITGVEVDNDGTAISLGGALKLILSVLTGKASGGGTTTLVFRDIADAKDRISATVDSNGNRTAIGTRDAS